MAGYVFVSYSRQDADYARKLVEWLRGNGIETWFDEGIRVGVRWERELRDRVDGCAALLLIMSPAAEDSKHVDNERDRAEEKGRPIVPLLLDGERFYGVGPVQYEDVRGGRLPGEAFLHTLRDLLGGPPPRQRTVAAVRRRFLGEPADQPVLPSLGGDLGGRVVWAPDGRLLAGCLPGGRSGWWVVASGGFAGPFDGHRITAGRISQVSLSRDGSVLATADSTGKVYVSQPGTEYSHRLHYVRRTGVWGAARQWFDHVGGVAVSPDGEWVAVSDYYGWTYLARMDGVVTHRAGVPITSTAGLAWSPDAKRLLIVGAGERCSYVDPATGAVDSDFRLSGARVADWSAEGNRIAVGGKDGAVVVMADGDAGFHAEEGHDGPVYAVAWSPDHRFLATGGRDGVLITDALRVEPSFRLVDERVPAVSSIAWSPDGLSLVTAGFDQAFRIWEVWR